MTSPALKMTPPAPASVGITITLRDLLDAQPALVRLANEKLPIKLAYNVARMVKALQPDLDEFMKQRNDLIKMYGATRETTEAERPIHGSEITVVLPEHETQYRQDIDELVNVTVTISREPLDPDGLERMTAADIVALGPLLRAY